MDTVGRIGSPDYVFKFKKFLYPSLNLFMDNTTFKQLLHFQLLQQCSNEYQEPYMLMYQKHIFTTTTVDTFLGSKILLKIF